MKAKLHRYSSDTDDRRYIHVYLTILSILLAYGLFWISKVSTIEIPWWFDAPSVFGFYGLLYILFAKVLWKKKFFRAIFRIKTPNWNGTYKCSLITSFDNFKSEKDLKVSITQDWDIILVQTETSQSKSVSLSASFAINDSTNFQLTYEYLNKPKNDADSSLNMHYGMAYIYFESKELKGEFFNGRGRNNFGTFAS